MAEGAVVTALCFFLAIAPTLGFVGRSGLCSSSSAIHITASTHIRSNVTYEVQVRSFYEAKPVDVTARIVSRLKTGEPMATAAGTASRLVQFDELTTMSIQVGELRDEDHDYFLEVAATEKDDRRSSLNFEISRNKLKVVHSRSLILIQFDKPKYRPGDVVQYHILIVDEHLLPVPTSIDVRIKDPNERVVQQTLQAQPTYSNHPGFIDGNFSLGLYDPLGEWRVEVTIGKQIEIRKFEVLYYVLPRFSVVLNAQPYVDAHADQPEFKIDVTARRPYGLQLLPVDSRFVLTVTGPTNIQKHYIQEKTNGFALFLLNATDIKHIAGDFCSSKGVEKRGSINISVTATELTLGKNQTQWTTVSYFCDPFFLHTKQSAIFHPTVPYNITVKVLDHSGSPVHDDFHSDYCNVSIQYSDELRPSQGVRTSWAVPLHGHNEVDVQLAPLASTRRMDVELKLRNVTRSFVVYGSASSSNRYMSLELITPSDLVMAGREASFQLSCTGGCPTVYYLVMSGGNIIQRGNRILSGKLKATLNISIENAMTPEATLLVYYVHISHNCRELISAAVDFKVDGLLRNTVELSVKPQDQSRSYAQPGQRPKEKAVLHINTKGSSLVGTVALDARLLQLAGAGNLTNSGLVWQVLQLVRERTNPSSINLSNLSDDFERSGLISQWVEVTASRGRRPEPASIGPFNSGHGGNDDAELEGVYPGMNENDFIPPKISSNRDDFRDMFFFRVFSTNSTGDVTAEEEVPDSITTWKFFAFSLNNESGLAFAKESTELQVYQHLITDIEMPINMIRNEAVTVDFLVTHHLRDEEDITLEISMRYGSASPFKIRHGIKTERTSGLARDAVWKVSVKIVPPGIGEIIVSAAASIHEGQAVKYMDTITKKIQVKAEGVTTEFTTDTYTVTTGRVLEIPVNMTHLSRNMVAGSLSLRLAVFGGDWAPMVETISSGAAEDFKSLIRLPAGCGEQNMAILMPNVYIAKYLAGLGVLTKNIKRKEALERHMKAGYELLFNYQLSDGSFSSWGKRQPKTPGSTWLTAFVLHGFSVGRAYFTQPRDLNQSFKFLESRQTPNGAFIEKGFLLDRELASYAQQYAALTAFVTLAFVEGGKTGLVTKKAETYLRNIAPNIERSPYALALVSYALAKLNSTVAREVAGRLATIGTLRPDGAKFWSDNRQEKPLSAKTVEATAYAILAFDELGGMKDQKEAGIKWLLSIPRDLQGGFVSTQDTVVALAALSRVTSRSADATPHLTFDLTCQPACNAALPKINKHTMLVYSKTEIPANTTKIILSTTGRGSAWAQLSYTFNEFPALTASNKSTTPAAETPTRKLSIEAAMLPADPSFPDAGTLQVKCRYTGSGNGINSQVIVTAEALTGYKFDDDTERLEGSEIDIERVEYCNNYSGVTIYFAKMDREPRSFGLRLFKEKNSRVTDIQDRPVKIVDYYEPNNSQTCMYRL